MKGYPGDLPLEGLDIMLNCPVSQREETISERSEGTQKRMNRRIFPEKRKGKKRYPGWSGGQIFVGYLSLFDGD